jgi:hypothetical protein
MLGMWPVRLMKRSEKARDLSSWSQCICFSMTETDWAPRE